MTLQHSTIREIASEAENVLIQRRSAVLIQGWPIRIGIMILGLSVIAIVGFRWWDQRASKFAKRHWDQSTIDMQRVAYSGPIVIPDLPPLAPSRLADDWADRAAQIGSLITDGWGRQDMFWSAFTDAMAHPPRGKAETLFTSADSKLWAVDLSARYPWQKGSVAIRLSLLDTSLSYSVIQALLHRSAEAAAGRLNQYLEFLRNPAETRVLEMPERTRSLRLLMRWWGILAGKIEEPAPLLECRDIIDLWLDELEQSAPMTLLQRRAYDLGQSMGVPGAKDFQPGQVDLTSILSNSRGGTESIRKTLLESLGLESWVPYAEYMFFIDLYGFPETRRSMHFQRLFIGPFMWNTGYLTDQPAQWTETAQLLVLRHFISKRLHELNPSFEFVEGPNAPKNSPLFIDPFPKNPGGTLTWNAKTKNWMSGGPDGVASSVFAPSIISSDDIFIQSDSITLNASHLEKLKATEDMIRRESTTETLPFGWKTDAVALSP